MRGSATHQRPFLKLPQRHVSEEEEVLPERQLCNQERSSSVDQEEPEPPQIKEEQGELCSSQEGEQLVLKEETLMVTVAEERYHSEPEPDGDQCLSCGSDSIVLVGSESRETEVFNNPIQNKGEINHQPRVLDITLIPETNLHRTDLPQQHVCKEEEVLPEQQLCNQVRSSSLDQEEPEPPQIKEEHCSSQEGEQLVLKEETDTFMIATHNKSDHSEPEPNSDQLLRHSPAVAESQDQGGSKNADSGSTTNPESKLKERLYINRSHSNNVEESPPSESRCNTDTVPPDLPQQHVCKEKQDVLPEQQLCNQERSSSLDQEEPEPPQIKEEEEELCSSQEKEQVVLKEETDTFMVTATYEERDHTPNRDQLLSHSTAVADSQSPVDSGSSKNSESKPKKRLHGNKSHSNNVEDSPPSKSRCNSDTGKKSLKCDVCGKAFKKKSQMKEHHRIHTGEKPYSCKACGKNFTHRSTLTVHMRTHTGEKPYHCKTCGKMFTCSSYLSVHIRTHTGEKLYPCKICGKVLTRRGYLLAHIRTHTGEKPYECKTCGKMFISSRNLLRHTKTHTGQKS